MKVVPCKYLLVVLVVAGWAGSASFGADDWPQWMGPQRDNQWREDGIVRDFSAGEPKVLWRAPVKSGYSGPAVADGRVFLTDFDSDDNVQVSNFGRAKLTGTERVLCFDEKTGKQLWMDEYPVVSSVSYPAGPRCTPVVDGDRVYTLGAEGMLVCFNVESGERIWWKELKEEYNTGSALWGYAAHPLIDGSNLICLAGGEGTHAVAFNKRTGEEVWRTLTSPEQGYSPPTIIEAAGVRQLILARADAISGVNPATGEEYWTTPYEATSGSIIMSPIRSGNYLFIGGYSDKNLLLELSQDKPGVKVVWRDVPRKAISPVNVQPYCEDGVMYGFDQRGQLLAVEIPSGERLWNTAQPIADRPAGSATAFIVKHKDRYFFFTEKGDLVIGKLSREGFEEIDRAHVLDPTGTANGRDVLWSAPAFANRTMFARNDKELIAVDLSVPAQ
jgi:outer membrane protein assembly factor BamB